MIDFFYLKFIGRTIEVPSKTDFVIDSYLGPQANNKGTCSLRSKGSIYLRGWRRFLRIITWKPALVVMIITRIMLCGVFFSLLKKDRVQRKPYRTRDEARAEIFDYIGGFYNLRRNHATNDGLSPVEAEKQFFKELESD